MARLTWLAAPIGPCLRFARRFQLTGRQTLRLLVDCWAGGAQPNEAHVWRRLMAPPGRHPLPGRAAVVALPRLGDPLAHRLLADKLATARLLTAAGVATPAILAQGGAPELDQPPWTQPARLFVKPRYGSAGLGTLAVDVLGGARFRLDGREPVDGERLRQRLGAGPWLAQPLLEPAAELADLATAGRAPVLRLNTAREPGGAPFLHSALLELDVPGEDPRAFIRGRVRVPVDPAGGLLCAGLWFLHPERRLDRLPWNGAALTGRPLPGFAAAVDLALRAMAHLPGLPLVNWDLIHTPDGPMLLEGNTGGDWILTDLSRVVGLDPPPLSPLLRRWCDPR